MSDPIIAPAHPMSAPIANPLLDIFSVPMTDVSVASYRFVPIYPYATGINPVEFQIDQQEDYIDLTRSYFEMELKLLKNDGSAIGAADSLWPTNNLAHTLFKQITVRLNGTLISPQTDTYHYKAYLETLLNYNRIDGDTILKPQGWFNDIDMAQELTDENTTLEHADFKGLSSNQQSHIRSTLAEKSKYIDNNVQVLRFTPHAEAFRLHKFLVPGVQIGIQMYFNPPEIFLNGVGKKGQITQEQVKIKLYLCQLRLNPTVYRNLRDSMRTKMVSYPTVRSEIRTFNFNGDEDRKEIDNLFQNRIPNRVIVGLVRSEAFTGKEEMDPFAFGKFGLQHIKQTIRGEEYPYETMELDPNTNRLDLRGYHRFLQASGALCNLTGNMVRYDDWGEGKNCTLFMFDNVANGCVDSPRLNPKQAGEMRIILQFGTAPGKNLVIIVYGEFENLLEINNVKSVMYNVYEPIA